ncbi:hypothetical protein ACIRS1_28810 [Kitasatospora sp. NPDC101176]|uniref:hypothetical protein n=1 Tax=Kitasatospora sp. NPDC101176 TaxID=3364099 RepID=UPI00380D417D
MSDPVHDTLGDRLRLLGTQLSAPSLPAAEIRRRADRRRRRRHALAATAACTAAVLCLALPSALHSPEPRRSPEPQQGAAPIGTPSVSASPSAPAAPAVTSTATTPIEAGAVARILGSCLGSEASKYHAVIAVRTPVASTDTDGVVIAVDSAGQYVQCESKGNKGTSKSVPATFINDRLWGAGHLIEFFDSFSTPTGAGQHLSLGAGHYTPDVAKVTISYGDDPTQYPAVMAGGAFAYAAAVTTGPDRTSFPPAPYVHAYDADGKEIYNQKTQPNVKNTRR